MGKRLEEIEKCWPILFILDRAQTKRELADLIMMANRHIKELISEIKRSREAIEKHIIEFDRLMEEMPSTRERGMKLAESVGDLQKALEDL